jgi:DNA replication protein DnaC
MRHDPASAAVVVMLRGLKMYGMAQAVGDLIEQGAPAFDAAIPILSQLLKAEIAEREVRSIAYQIKAARFPAYKDMAGFDFASSEVNEAMVRQLHRGEFINGADNVVLIGGPGTGKTHIATALAVEACGRGKRIRFWKVTELVTHLIEARQERQLARMKGQLAKLDLLVLDELGYVPTSKRGAELLFDVISTAYERTSLIVTTNLPSENWTEVLGSERLTGAVLDRLTHRCQILEATGESYRLQDARRRRGVGRKSK